MTTKASWGRTQRCIPVPESEDPTVQDRDPPRVPPLAQKEMAELVSPFIRLKSSLLFLSDSSPNGMTLL